MSYSFIAVLLVILIDSVIASLQGSFETSGFFVSNSSKYAVIKWRRYKCFAYDSLTPTSDCYSSLELVIFLPVKCVRDHLVCIYSHFVFNKSNFPKNTP